MASLIAALKVVAVGASVVCIGFAAYFWRATLYKAKLYARSILYLFFTGDNKWKVTDVRDPGHIDAEQGGNGERRTIIFIRHGESQWNETFNRGWNPIFFFPRLVYACLYELFLLLKGERDSWFYDSPLSVVGIRQAESLRKSVISESELAILSGKGAARSSILCSPLRRAISTAAVGLYDRLRSNDEKITLLPCLQEISRNMDTLCITPAHGTPVTPWLEAAYRPLDIPKIYSGRIDSSLYTGNKELRSTGLERMMTFNQYVFSKPSEETIIVVGHSLWFRSYLQTFLPRASCYKGKTKKMHNCAAVAFTITCVEDGDQTHYKIEEASLTELHLGFQ